MKDLTASPRVSGTAAAGRPAASIAGSGRHLIALTRDASLAQALQGLSAGGLTIHLVEDLRRLADELMQHATAVALLDAQALGVPADAAVDAIKSQFPEVRLMVAGLASEQKLLASRISRQTVFRFVHKPASPERLKLFLDAASQQPVASRPGASASLPLAAAAGGATRPPSGAMQPMWIALAATALVLLGLLGWWLLREDASSTMVAASVEPAPRTDAGELTAMLARADVAFSAGKFVAADGSSAAEMYREATRLDATSTAATDGFERAIEQALAGAEQALLDGQLDAARATAELLRLIVPENSRLDFLHTQIERELARLNADATQRRALESRRAEIQAAVQVVEQRIASGALLDPLTDNAVSRFREAQAIGGGDPLVRGSRDALVAALLTAADAQLGEGSLAGARRLVDAAGTVNSSAPGLDIMRRRVDEAAQRQAAANSARSAAAVTTPPPAVASGIAPAADPPPGASESPQQPASTQPAIPGPPATNSAPAAAGDGIVQASTLRVRRRAAPEYPQAALQSLVSGWVEMEFVIEKDGSVRDVVVSASEPSRLFDAAAVSAMKRYRFEPVLRDGEPVEQRARLRMSFKAEDG